MKKHSTVMKAIRPSTTRRISRCNTRASEQAIAERLPPSPTLCTRKGKSVYQAFSTSTPALTVTIPFILTSRYYLMPITSQRSCTKMTDNLVQLRTWSPLWRGLFRTRCSFKGRQPNHHLPRLWHTRGPRKHRCR